MFTRNGADILTFRVYDGYGNCVDEFTGTMAEWQSHVGVLTDHQSEKPPSHLHLLN